MDEELKIELVKSSYTSHFSLIQHYSNLLFKARVSTITLLIIFWAIILDVGPELKRDVYAVFSVIIPVKAALALIGSLLLLFLASMEFAYLKRYYLILQSARMIEEQYSFTTKLLTEWGSTYSFYVFYVLNYALFIGLFVVVFVRVNPSATQWTIAGSIVALCILLLRLFTRSARILVIKRDPSVSKEVILTPEDEKESKSVK